MSVFFHRLCFDPFFLSDGAGATAAAAAADC